MYMYYTVRVHIFAILLMVITLFFISYSYALRRYVRRRTRPEAASRCFDKINCALRHGHRQALDGVINARYSIHK